MKDRKELLYPRNNPDGATIPLSVWIPPKTLVEDFRGYKIFKSDPLKSMSETANGAVQLAIVHPTIHGDLLRADSYREGYFAATWLSNVQLPQFLDSAEKYFQEFEDQFKGEVHGTMGIFSSWREPDFWEFDRPLRQEDLDRENAFTGSEDHPLGLVRLETAPADLCFQPKDEAVGIIAYLDKGEEQPTIDAVSRFVNRTQTLLPENVVTRSLELLPHRRIVT